MRIIIPSFQLRLRMFSLFNSNKNDERYQPYPTQRKTNFPRERIVHKMNRVFASWNQHPSKSIVGSINFCFNPIYKSTPPRIIRVREKKKAIGLGVDPEIDCRGFVTKDLHSVSVVFWPVQMSSLFLY